MIVKNIKLKNFRNFKELDVKLDDVLNIFIGDNGQGKTNLLESIYLCSIGKTFRINSENDLIKFNEKNLEVEILLEKSNLSITKRINFSYTRNQKKIIKVNGVKLEKNSELIGILNNVIFTPDDLKIIKGSPNERRKFVNIDISQIKPKYKYLLKNYNKVIIQRNRILKSGNKVDNNILSIWNDYMVEMGTEIIIYRREYIKNLKVYASNIYGNISERKENLDLLYKCDIGSVKDLNKKEIKSKFREKLEKISENEKIRKITLCGPQKDDIMFKINNKDFKYFGSQGQQRSAILALKLAEIEIIKNEIGEYPVLLLDDVLSELDNKRKNYLIRYIKNIQTFITSTDDNDLKRIIKNNKKKIFNINEGIIGNIIN
ncbi:DNA replication/repair protein RecF [Sedimentibacter sp. zth1]|uniref:DNA replication/repair protein RecF n=1 Tax=Sedimentibacter sp. zth1 TaxID=2816908 RepID=UPI001A924929|nr:DNA replication/repair protein RecF [Sedimentibacter sp. zth1]QSX05179.1 DNA replication/repair protein RecF [Sedimentibacter sp. zth1]